MQRGSGLQTIVVMSHRSKRHFTSKSIGVLFQVIVSVNAAKELLAERKEGNQDAAFQLLPQYGRELARVNSGIEIHALMPI